MVGWWPFTVWDNSTKLQQPLGCFQNWRHQRIWTLRSNNSPSRIYFRWWLFSKLPVPLSSFLCFSSELAFIIGQQWDLLYTEHTQVQKEQEDPKRLSEASLEIYYLVQRVKTVRAKVYFLPWIYRKNAETNITWQTSLQQFKISLPLTACNAPQLMYLDGSCKHSWFIVQSNTDSLKSFPALKQIRNLAQVWEGQETLHKWREWKNEQTVVQHLQQTHRHTLNGS